MSEEELYPLKAIAEKISPDKHAVKKGLLDWVFGYLIGRTAIGAGLLFIFALLGADWGLAQAFGITTGILALITITYLFITRKWR